MNMIAGTVSHPVSAPSKLRIGLWHLLFDNADRLIVDEGDADLPFTLRLVEILLADLPELEIDFPITPECATKLEPLHGRYPERFHPLVGTRDNPAVPVALVAPVEVPSWWKRILGTRWKSPEATQSAGENRLPTLVSLIAQSECDLWIVTSIEHEAIARHVLKSVRPDLPSSAVIVARPNTVDEIALGVLKISRFVNAADRTAIREDEYPPWDATVYRWLDRYRRAFGPLAPEAIPPANRDEPYRITLFLPIFYSGGVWQATKSLMACLSEVNRRRRLLSLTLLVSPTQTDCESLSTLGDDLRLRQFDWEIIPHYRVFWKSDNREWDHPSPVEWTWPQPSATEEDTTPEAIFGLVDRIHAPLLPRVPAGFLVYDMIQLFVPEVFGASFWNWYEKGMKPTLRAAQCVVATSRTTLDLAQREYGFELDRGRLLPVACDVSQRFNALQPDPSIVPDRPYFLYVANSTAHKGALTMLRGYAHLKAQLGDQTPKLIHCGYGVERFSAMSPPDRSDPHFGTVRQLIVDLELSEGPDLAFLGFVTDNQLMALYAGASAVINAAKFDNGSYNMIEGHYFGSPLVSSDYPAMRELAERFQLPIGFFPVDDAMGLAVRLREALSIPPLKGESLERVRTHLNSHEYSFKCYAERLYDILIELGEAGRKVRSGKK